MLSIYAKLSYHVLTTWERVAVNMQGSKIDNSAYYQELNLKMFFFMIVRCDAAENYMLEIHNWCKWLDCDMGK